MDNPTVAAAGSPRSPTFHCQPKEIAMSHDTSSASRRRFFRITAVGLAAAPFATALMSGVAHAVDTVKESDATAKALGYVMDATKSTTRTDKAATCSSCSLFTGKAGAADGPCAIFQGNLVSAKGWCTAWVKKA
jgi:High potential iron-sulfur protein